MVAPQEDTFLPEYMREPLTFTDKEKEASTYHPLFEVPLWTGEIQDKKEIPSLLTHFKKSHSASDMTVGYGTKEDQHLHPGGRRWNIVDSRTRVPTTQSNGINILDDGVCKSFVQTIQEECSRILKHSPEEHTIHYDQIAISGAYVGHLPPGGCLEQTIAPNNELVGLLILETPPMTGELYFQDPAWIAKSMTSHSTTSHSFPSPEVTQQFSFDEGQFFLYPSWLPISMTNNRKVDDPDNTGIWFINLRISFRTRTLDPVVIISDVQTEAEKIYQQVSKDNHKYQQKLEELGELN